MNTLRMLPFIEREYQNTYLGIPKVYLPPPIYQAGSRVFRKKTLIFDLDETMIHCKECEGSEGGHGMSEKIEVNIPVDEEDISMVSVEVYVRPYLRECLEELSLYYQLVVFTASEQSYADPILNALDPKNNLFAHRLYRPSCIPTSHSSSLNCGSTYLKDLRILANRDPADLLLVDNATFCFAL
jgi:CTD small phosphatase-like protein 2